MVEPTEAMIESGVDALLDCAADPQSPSGRREIVRAIWRAMERHVRRRQQRIHADVRAALPLRSEWSVDEMLAHCACFYPGIARHQVGQVLNYLCRIGEIENVGYRGGPGGAAVYRLISANRDPA